MVHYTCLLLSGENHLLCTVVDCSSSQSHQVSITIWKDKDHILLYHGKCYHNAIWSIVDFPNNFKKESWGSSYSCLRNAFARDVCCCCCPSRSTAARYSESAARWTHSCSWGDDGSAFFLVNSKTCWLPLRNTTSLSACSTCTVGLASILTWYSLYVGYYSH